MREKGQRRFLPIIENHSAIIELLSDLYGRTSDEALVLQLGIRLSDRYGFALLEQPRVRRRRRGRIQEADVTNVDIPSFDVPLAIDQAKALIRS